MLIYKLLQLRIFKRMFSFKFSVGVLAQRLTILHRKTIKKVDLERSNIATFQRSKN